MREIFRGGEGLSYDEGVKHLSNHPTKEKNTIDKPTQATGRKQSECIARIAYTLPMIIFCVFSSVFAQSPTKVGAVAKTKQEISTKGLVIGDSLPDWFWEQELQVVNHPQKSKTIKLSAYKQQLLVLDFLNTACVPCIKSVDKWNKLQSDYRLEVSVLPIHLYGDNSRIAPFAVQRGWEMPIAVGNRADTLINQLFYVRRSFGQVWIKDGKLLAIPHNKDVSRTLIGRALTRRDLGIQMNDMLTYFDRRYFINKGGASKSEKLDSTLISRATVPYFVSIKDVSKLKSQILNFSPDANLNRYPLQEYIIKKERISPIGLGKRVPEAIWDLPLRIVNDPLGRDSVTLAMLATDKLLIIDFWSTWCKPCLESMNKWESFFLRYSDKVQLVGMMMDYDYKAELTIAKSGWSIPQIVGPETYLLNTYLCGTPIIGPSVWIYQGKLWGLTDTHSDNERLLQELLSGRTQSMPQENKWKGLHQ